MGYTRTNPIVGCVIVYNDLIIGEGYHHEFGGPHAEVIAIRSVRDQSLLSGSTLYANLEPCTHHGKTPPCSLLIRQKKIPRVVVSNTDPFPSVNGLGITQMREAGIGVEADCLADEGTFVNRRFFCYQEKKRPYVILKWAQTSDSFIDLVREPGDPVGTNWITDDICRTLVHKWRAEESAIMVGINTILTDNPKLNIRKWAGYNPVRIVLDRQGIIPEGASVLDGSQDTILFAGKPGKYPGRIRKISIDPQYSLKELLEALFEEKIISLFVEGGARLINSFLRSGMWDEARVFTGKMTFGQGVKAPECDGNPDETVHFQDTKLEIFRNRQ